MQIAHVVEQQRLLENPRSRRRRRARTVRFRPARPAASDQLRLGRMFQEFARETQAQVERLIFPILRRWEPEFLIDAMRTTDDLSDELTAAFDEIRVSHLALARQRSEGLALELTGRANRRNRERFYRSVENAVGIDLSAVAEESGLVQVLTLKTKENVDLIQSIPDEYLGKVQRIVYENVIQGRKSSQSMMKELKMLGDITDARARFIARDQTAKLTAALNRERNQALGIEQYIWRTSKDASVRKTHRENAGKKFRFDDPPAKTGNPGEDYQCRCWAEPVITL
jgi:SPP1 gp7 family putative phage head morphogenesis protein